MERIKSVKTETTTSEKLRSEFQKVCKQQKVSTAYALREFMRAEVKKSQLN